MASETIVCEKQGILVLWGPRTVVNRQEGDSVEGNLCKFSKVLASI